MKAFNQIRNAIELIKGYKAPEPLNVYLKSEFKKRPQFGSNDRRLMRELCICYFKMGNAMPTTEYEKRILIGFFLNNTITHPVFEFLADDLKFPQLIGLIDQNVNDKLNGLDSTIQLDQLFPFPELLHASFKNDIFYKNFFNKPTTWLRFRIKAKERIEDFLKQQKINYTIHPECTVAYGFGEQINVSAWPTNIQQAIEVQDISSQLSLYGIELKDKEKVWDCCAASGGKSLLVHSQNSKIELYVSDVRHNIIKNLEERFKIAGIGNSFKAVVDLSKPLTDIVFENNKERKNAKAKYFDTIIVDAPCSGSGTWRRNPERLTTMTKAELDQYIHLQKEIVKNAFVFLKPGGRLIYLTCSIFEAEDDAIVNQLSEELHMKVVEQKYINGMDWGGDVMYKAVMIK